MDKETAKYIIDYFSHLLTEEDNQTINYPYLSNDEKAYHTHEVAQKLLEEKSDAIFFNYCPKCGQLARTPQAKQCKCGHQWHDLRVATFKLNDAFSINKRGFFLIGEIKSGAIQIGNLIDLTPLNLNCKSKIQSIEFVLKKQDGKIWEDIALKIDTLTQTQKDYLTTLKIIDFQLDIINEK